MEFTKWSSKKYLYCFVLTALIGITLGHMIKKHKVTGAPKPVLAEALPLPTETPLQHNLKPTSQVLPITKTIAFKTSIIHHSLAQAARDAGLTAQMTRQLDAMFASHYLARKIHSGDRLEVLYHEYFIGNQKDHPGSIIAAKIVDPDHKNLKLVRFITPDHTSHYYTANGQSTKPSYLTTPLHYHRIGSKFNYHRYDPVLHKVHPHLGVDFDAPLGTPVKAIGNGIVLFCNQMHGYGNAVIIQYNHTYKTLYAHLEKFARHLHPHEYVKKGEIVGYVGSTGWSTGPHLHYSLYKNGTPVNPLTIHFPSASLPEKYRHAFFNDEHRWFSKMQLFESAMLASEKTQPG